MIRLTIEERGAIEAAIRTVTRGNMLPPATLEALETAADKIEAAPVDPIDAELRAEIQAARKRPSNS